MNLRRVIAQKRFLQQSRLSAIRENSVIPIAGTPEDPAVEACSLVSWRKVLPVG